MMRQQAENLLDELIDAVAEYERARGLVEIREARQTIAAKREYLICALTTQGYTAWTEWQLVEGRKIIGRYDLKSQAESALAAEERERKSETAGQ